MSAEETIATLLREVQGTAAYLKSSDGTLSRRLDEMQARFNGIAKMFGRPHGGGDLDHFDARAGATKWLEAKHLADSPKRGGLLQSFAPAGDLVDSALTARSALTKMISLQTLDAVEQKALSMFNLGGSGYICPPEWSDRILSCVQEGTDVLGAVFTQTIGAASLNFFVDDAQVQATWHCETDCAPPPSQDIAGQLGSLTVGADELRFATCATRSLVEDSAINIESWLLGKATLAFRRALADAVMVGTGVGQPLGLLRSAIPICDVPSSTPSAQFGWQDLVSMWAALPAAYKPNASWVMNSLTLGLLLTISDAAGRPIVLPGLSGGAPLILLGRPILIDERMPDVATGATPILLADLHSLYIVVLRSGPTLLPPVVSYCITYNFTQRAGGTAACPNAGLLLRIP